LKTFLRGETVTIEDEFYVEGVLTTPDGGSPPSAFPTMVGYQVEIDDPFRVNVVNNQAMTAVSTGLLRYNYTIDSAATLGIYKADAIYVHGGVTTKERHYFKVALEVD